MKPILFATLIVLASPTTTLGQLVPFPRPTFEIPLTVTDGQTTLVNYCGIFPGASFCITESDSINGHQESQELPPPPGIFDSRFVWPRDGTNGDCFATGSPADFRPFAGYLQRDTFRVNVSFENQLPVTISWPSNLSSFFRKLILTDVATGGGTTTVDMLTATSVSLNADPVQVRLFAGGPRTPNDTIEVQVQVLAGWNFVSVPVRNPTQDSVVHVFPGAVYPYVFEFTGGYVQRFVVRHGVGYWVKFPSSRILTFRGTGYANDTINVTTGWNFIGAPFYPVSIDSVRVNPPILIGSGFFGYSSGYSRATSIVPGGGYFVKCSGAGRIVFPGNF
jgi:hypothetical protein